MGSNVPTKKKKPRSRARRISEWTAALTVATLLLTISVVALIVLGSDIASALGLNKVPYLSTTLAIIFGTTTLISFLTVATIMFFRLRLTDRGEALGLPQGSVRALIALILIVIFAIMVIYMYADLKVKPLTYPNGTYMTDENGTILYEPQPLDSQIDFGTYHVGFSFF